jgi:DNA-binding response OmpR family regulator
LQVVTAARELAPSLILLDVQMPRMDGHTFMQYVRARSLAIPVLLISGSGGLDAPARESDVRAYLKKPFDLDELLSKVEALIAR